jgi:hypothetical protein
MTFWSFVVGARFKRASFVLAMLIVCGAFGESQPPAPSPAESAHNKKPLGAQGENPENNQRGTNKSPLVVSGQVSAAVKGEVTTKKTVEETADQTQYREQKAFGERIALILSAISLLISIALTVITGLLARFTWKLWTETGNLVSGAEQTAKRQLRAHVFMDNGSISNVANPLPTYVGVPTPNPAAVNFPAVGPIIQMQIKNYGQTPAYDVIHWTAVPVIREFPLNPQIPLPRRTKIPGAIFTRATMGPQGGIKKVITMNAPLTAQEIADLRSGNKAIYVWGTIVYQDIFQKWQRTRYRMIHTVHAGAIGLNTDLTGYGDGNDAT